MTPETLATAREAAEWHKAIADYHTHSTSVGEHHARYRDAINALVQEVQKPKEYASPPETVTLRANLAAALTEVSDLTRQLEEARRELRTRGAAKGGQR